MLDTKENEVLAEDNKNRVVTKARVKTQWRNGAPTGSARVAEKWACDVVYIDDEGCPAVRDAWIKNRKVEPKIQIGEIVHVEMYTGSDGKRYCEVLDTSGLL